MAEQKDPYADRDFIEPLDLDWLIENKLPVFVRNTTRPRGQVAVNFQHPTGKVKVEKIPRTHLPINLSRKLSPDTILLSDDFRAMISKGVIELVRPDIAWDELQNPENAHEIERLQLSDFSAKSAFVSPRVKAMEKTDANRVDPNAPSLEPLGVETSVLTPRVLSLVERLQNGDMPIKTALSELKTMEPELKDTDCSYIITNGPDGQIRSYAQKVLAKLRGQQIASTSVEDDGDLKLSPEEEAREAQREAAARAYQGESPQAREAALNRNGIY